MKLAGFIMTYERSEIIGGTIEKVLSQTIPPDKLLIVDNSESDKTKLLIESLGDKRVEYVAVGYNSGPAGAAKIGLQRLSQEGYDWIYWGDDDDPPQFEDSFEKLLALATANGEKKIGVVGAVGHYFNGLTGEIKRVGDEELSQSEFLHIDSIAGNQCMIVNAQVVREGIVPKEPLFFGFEELDFCLRVKAGNFELAVSTDLFKRARQKYDRINYKNPTYIKQKSSALKRQYYSTRNLLQILYGFGYHRALFYQILKNMIKSIYGFKFGFSYGSKNMKMILMGIYHFMTNQSGKQY